MVSQVFEFSETEQLVGFWGAVGTQAILGLGAITLNHDCLNGNVIEENQDTDDQSNWGIVILISVAVIFGLIVVPLMIFVGIKVIRKNKNKILVPDTERNAKDLPDIRLKNNKIAPFELAPTST